MSNYREKAKELALRSYTLVMLRDPTTDEGDFVYMAMNPEIEGCKAQGLTMEEAQENLNEVRIDLIEHLLTHGLSVPVPTTTAGVALLELGEMIREANMDEFFERTIQPKDREQLFEASLKT